MEHSTMLMAATLTWTVIRHSHVEAHEPYSPQTKLSSLITCQLGLSGTKDSSRRNCDMSEQRDRVSWTSLSKLLFHLSSDPNLL